jgi:hypothetical protein
VVSDQSSVLFHLTTEGSHGAVWEVLPAFDYLFKRLKKRADECELHPELFVNHYRHCINYGFKKLSEYYQKTDDTPIYRVAVALHPAYRFDYFNNAWAKVPRAKAEIKGAKDATKQLFTDYLTLQRENEPPLSPTPPTKPSAQRHYDSDDYDSDYDTSFNTAQQTTVTAA